MFTGIIEEVGKIKNIQGGTNYKLTIAASKILEDIHLGDSIAVNGICLTAISWDNDSFTVDIMRETLERTSLHRLSISKTILSVNTSNHSRIKIPIQPCVKVF